MREMAASFLIISRPGKIDEDTPHQAGTKAKEMGAILPIDVVCIDQPEIDLMNQGSGLQGLTGLFTCHVAMGQAVQLVVNKGHQSFESTVVSQTPSSQQAGYFGVRGRRGFVQTAHTPPLGGQGYHSPAVFSTAAGCRHYSFCADFTH